jgi:hypothetical protein
MMSAVVRLVVSRLVHSNFFEIDPMSLEVADGEQADRVRECEPVHLSLPQTIRLVVDRESGDAVA